MAYQPPMQQQQPPMQPQHYPRAKKKASVPIALAIVMLAAGLFVGIGIGAAGGGSKTAAAPAVTVTVTAAAAAPAAQPKPKAKPVPAKPAGPAAAATIGEGTYQVPQDVKPGLYKTGGPTAGNCYWARLKGLGGSVDDIIANGSPNGPATVKVATGDKGFETSGCKPWTKIG